jgi:hypothetical protein
MASKPGVRVYGHTSGSLAASYGPWQHARRLRPHVRRPERRQRHPRRLQVRQHAVHRLPRVQPRLVRVRIRKLAAATDPLTLAATMIPAVEAAWDRASSRPAAASDRTALRVTAYKGMPARGALSAGPADSDFLGRQYGAALGGPARVQNVRVVRVPGLQDGGAGDEGVVTRAGSDPVGVAAHSDMAAVRLEKAEIMIHGPGCPIRKHGPAFKFPGRLRRRWHTPKRRPPRRYVPHRRHERRQPRRRDDGGEEGAEAGVVGCKGGAVDGACWVEPAAATEEPDACRAEILMISSAFCKLFLLD